jgi:hypothetical protein
LLRESHLFFSAHKMCFFWSWSKLFPTTFPCIPSTFLLFTLTRERSLDSLPFSLSFSWPSLSFFWENFRRFLPFPLKRILHAIFLREFLEMKEKYWQKLKLFVTQTEMWGGWGGFGQRSK